jgi:hypothetical protein
MKTYNQNTISGKVTSMNSPLQHRPINSTFTKFIKEVSLKLGEPTCSQERALLHEKYRGKQRAAMRIIYLTHVVEFVTDDYTVKFCPSSNGVIELFKIEVRTQRKGLGTDLMNTILDVCDYTNIKCELIPIEYINCYEKSTPIDILTQWYGSFGFKKSKLTEFFFYTPTGCAEQINRHSVLSIALE